MSNLRSTKLIDTTLRECAGGPRQSACHSSYRRGVSVVLDGDLVLVDDAVGSRECQDVRAHIEEAKAVGVALPRTQRHCRVEFPLFLS